MPGPPVEATGGRTIATARNSNPVIAQERIDASDFDGTGTGKLDGVAAFRPPAGAPRASAKHDKAVRGNARRLPARSLRA